MIATIETEDWSPALYAEPTATERPWLTTMLRRDGETAWIHAYPDAGLVVVAYPSLRPASEGGMVRELGVAAGDRERCAARYVREISLHECRGWVYCPGIGVRVETADRWATSGPLPY